VGNTALDSRLLGAPDEPSRSARLRHAIANAATSPREVWRFARKAYVQDWESKRSLTDVADSAAPAIKRHAEALAPTALPIRVLDHYVEPLFVASAVAGIVVGLIAPQAWLDDPAGGSQWLLVLGIWLPAAVIGGALNLAPFSERVQRVNTEAGHLLLNVGIGCLWVALVLGIDRWGAPFGFGDTVAYSISAGALSAGAMNVGLIMLIAAYVTLEYTLRRLAIKRHADSVFVQSLLEALTDLFFLDGRDHGHRGLDPRRDAVRYLETAAVAAERFLPRQLAPGDEATAKWLGERGAEWAAAVRSHKRWVLTQRTKDERATDRLRRTVEAAARGDWNDLDRRPAYQASRRSMLRTLVGTTLRGASPLAVVILLRAFGVPGLEGAIGNYVLIGSGVWLVLSFLAQYDPLFGAKIGAAADISKTLRGG
jgi:hypothetical protein